MTVSEHGSERLSESVRLDMNACILSKSQDVLIWMAVARSGLAERCTGWSTRLCLGLITRWLIFKPTPNNRTIPCYARLHNNSALTAHYKQTARSNTVHCLSVLAAWLTCISSQKGAPLFPQLILAVSVKCTGMLSCFVAWFCQ